MRETFRKNVRKKWKKKHLEQKKLILDLKEMDPYIKYLLPLVPFFVSVLFRCAILSFVIVSSADDVSGDALVVFRLVEFVASETTVVFRFKLI